MILPFDAVCSLRYWQRREINNKRNQGKVEKEDGEIGEKEGNEGDKGREKIERHRETDK
jgi:hypothetical protein